MFGELKGEPLLLCPGLQDSFLTQGETLTFYSISCKNRTNGLKMNVYLIESRQNTEELNCKIDSVIQQVSFTKITKPE